MYMGYTVESRGFYVLPTESFHLGICCIGLTYAIKDRFVLVSTPNPKFDSSSQEFDSSNLAFP